jgi:hypothetical protein
MDYLDFLLKRYTDDAPNLSDAGSFMWRSWMIRCPLSRRDHTN